MQQPVQPYDDNSKMPFGKYKDQALANVPAVYLLWLYNQGCSHPQLKAYLISRLEIIKREAAKCYPGWKNN